MPMSRRIDIELTSSLGDGNWTWRAAGARQPKGVLDGSILPPEAKIGDEFKVEIEQEMDGLTILNVVHGRQKHDAENVIELLPSEREFKPVVETRAKRGKGDRRPRRDGDRGPRRDRDRDRNRDGRGDRRDGDRGQKRDGDRGQKQRDRQGGRRGPSFSPPPEIPQRPKPKRLKPGKANRNAVLEGLPDEQRAIAEVALQGMGAVRQRLHEANDQAVKEGRPTMPEQSVMKMAEDLLPKLRVAEWLDRAEAAQRQMAHLDLRDLRSVVAAAGDPMVARDEATRTLRDELTAALATKQEEETLLWFGDIDAALAVGRVIRALRLSSQPPKAGVPFPTDIAKRLVDSTNASLAPMDSSERWSATLEAAAFSPIHAQICPVRKPDAVDDDLLATVKRLAPALPQVAALFEVEVDPKAKMPKPLRPTYGKRKGEADSKSSEKGSDRDKRGKRNKRGRDGGKPAEARTPAAQPATATGPEPTPVTEPEPATTTATEPTPVTEPEPATTTEPATATATEPTPVTEPEPATTTEPATEPAPEPAPTTATATEPVAESTPKPAADAAASPIIDDEPTVTDG